MEQKTVEQIAEEHAMNHSDSGQQETAKYSFIDGYTTAQQSQPMWREIEGDKRYNDVIVKTEEGRVEQYQDLHGQVLRAHGYTHYLSSDDLLKLPVKKK